MTTPDPSWFFGGPDPVNFFDGPGGFYWGPSTPPIPPTPVRFLAFSARSLTYEVPS